MQMEIDENCGNGENGWVANMKWGWHFEYEVDGIKPKVCFALISCPLLLLHVPFKTFRLVRIRFLYDAAP